MPFYSYHLEFELYPSPAPTLTPTAESTNDNLPVSEGGNRSIWLPLTGAEIFDDLPTHPRKRKTIRSRESKDKQVVGGTLSPGDSNSRGQQSRPTVSHLRQTIVDCGSAQANTQSGDRAANTGAEKDAGGNGSNIVHPTERQWRAGPQYFGSPRLAAGTGLGTAAFDWRFGCLSIESFDIERRNTEMSAATGSSAPAASLGPNLGGPGQATKARYQPLETKNTEVGWGIVHLYRECAAAGLSCSPAAAAASGDGEAVVGEKEGCILCIPAVPSYLSPSDFLGFVGEKWRRDVSHYRMVMTSRMNRYMVLMKFRDNRRAREWRKEFDGKVFDSMEAEICHVTFIKSITVETPGLGKNRGPEAASTSIMNSLKPFPPPTPDLTEMPTCPVCLERMDDTAGLMSILCQHVFHCTCLQTWKGSGCPVCRATNPHPPPNEEGYEPNSSYARPFGAGGASNLCSVCDETSDLWICLVCGNVGCGRYKGAHAKEHWKETAHSFSLELETQHVWDYAGDMWVHRLIRDKGDGKVVELPSNAQNGHISNSQRRRQQGRGRRGEVDNNNDDQEDEEEDVVPRAKLDNIGLEYTHLLTSQLESQRVYFEEMVNKAADKAAQAAAAAEQSSAQAKLLGEELAAFKEEHCFATKETIPQLERDLAREKTKNTRASHLARSLTAQLQEEKKVGEGLMERIEHVNGEMDKMRAKMEALQTDNAGLKEMNRDLTMFISGQGKLKALEAEGKVEQGEIEASSVSVPEGQKKGKAKGRRK